MSSYLTRSQFKIPDRPPRDVVLLNEFKVEGLEDVKTPAGTFVAYRIFHRQKVQPPIQKEVAGRDEGRVRYWYSPNART